MTDTHYLPGDRIVNPLISSHLVQTGTIQEIDTATAVIRFDNSGEAHTWSIQSVNDILTRQPIEVGCWVRTNYDRHINFVGKVVRMEKNKIRVELNWPVPQEFVLNEVVRIEEPKSIGGMRFEVMEDGTTRASVKMDKTLYLQQVGRGHRVPDTATLAQDAINRLAEFIMSKIPGEPSQSEGAVDTAIRIMTEQRKQLNIANNARLDAIGERDEAHAAIRQAGKLLRSSGLHKPGMVIHEGLASDWLAKHDPEKPTFKRGDLVTWGVGAAPMGRIVGPGVAKDTFEIIVLHEGSEGRFLNVYASALRHIN